jgi:hypothetical protein
MTNDEKQCLMSRVAGHFANIDRHTACDWIYCATGDSIDPVSAYELVGDIGKILDGFLKSDSKTQAAILNASLEPDSAKYG